MWLGYPDNLTMIHISQLNSKILNPFLIIHLNFEQLTRILVKMVDIILTDLKLYNGEHILLTKNTFICKSGYYNLY